eukprot:6207223-Pleurochrysis_carterae.AAC.1
MAGVMAGSPASVTAESGAPARDLVHCSLVRRLVVHHAAAFLLFALAVLRLLALVLLRSVRRGQQHPHSPRQWVPVVHHALEVGEDHSAEVGALAIRIREERRQIY